MLQPRPNCECCDRNLAGDSAEAFICTYERTFCESCASDALFKPQGCGNRVA